jgi:hypothetical protein
VSSALVAAFAVVFIERSVTADGSAIPGLYPAGFNMANPIVAARSTPKQRWTKSRLGLHCGEALVLDNR